jgi:hypothetical protein
MGIIDELDRAVEYKPKKREAEEEYRPSSYNPLISYPENLWEEAKGAGKQMYRGAQELGQGHVGSAAWDVGMGALRGAYSPVEAGVRSATFPLSDVTGVPESYLDIGANVALAGPSLIRSGGKLARKFMGVGGEAEAAAPAAEAAKDFDVSKMRSDFTPSPTMDVRAMTGGYKPATAHVGDMSPAERFFPEEGPRLLPQFGKGEQVYRMPDKSRPSMGESYAEGYKPGGQAEQMMFGPDRMLPPPAIRLPDMRPKWSKPEAESGILMPGIRRRPEEIAAGTGERRMLPEQQIPDYTLGTFASKAAERAGRMRGEQEAFREAIPKFDYGERAPRDITRPTPVEPGVAPLSREEKLSRLEGLAPERRYFGEQAPAGATKTLAAAAAERARMTRGARPAAAPETRPTRKINRGREEAPRSMPKEEKLKTLESEVIRSTRDAVRTLEATGMETGEAEKHILDAVRRGYMTAVRPNGMAITAKEAKRLRSLKGIGGVSWKRG